MVDSYLKSYLLYLNVLQDLNIVAKLIYKDHAQVG